MYIFSRNYQAVVKRGLITGKTDDIDFANKLKEELNETYRAILNDDENNLTEEITDCLVVCSNWLIHRGVNIEDILEKIAEKNEKRANELK